MRKIDLNRFAEIINTANPNIVKKIVVEGLDKDNRGYYSFYKVKIGKTSYLIRTSDDSNIYTQDLNERFFDILKNTNIKINYIN